jgi:hypothetical protein
MFALTMASKLTDLFFLQFNSKCTTVNRNFPHYNKPYISTIKFRSACLRKLIRIGKVCQINLYLYILWYPEH